MKRNELPELYYVSPLANVPSILEHGILSHRRASAIAHDSVAAVEIQNRRRSVVVPGGRELHEYANLYICARNPMLSRRRAQHLTICVLRVATDVLDLPGAIVSDKNASSDYARFAPAPRGLEIVDAELTFAEYWTDDDQVRYWQKKSAKCAEILVPGRIDSRFVKGAYVSCEEALTSFQKLGVELACSIDAHLFFL